MQYTEATHLADGRAELWLCQNRLSAALRRRTTPLGLRARSSHRSSVLRAAVPQPEVHVPRLSARVHIFLPLLSRFVPIAVSSLSLSLLSLRCCR